MLLALFQAVYLIVTRLAVSAQLRNLNDPKKNNPLGRVLLAFRGDGKRIENAELAELRISEAVLREVPRLERFQSFLRLAVAAGPLLGLIGTVIGMIITFRAIVASGTSDPKLMADGIGQAMIATVLGLGIAIPLLFINVGSRGAVACGDADSRRAEPRDARQEHRRAQTGLIRGDRRAALAGRASRSRFPRRSRTGRTLAAGRTRTRRARPRVKHAGGPC